MRETQTTQMQPTPNTFEARLHQKEYSDQGDYLTRRSCLSRPTFRYTDRIAFLSKDIRVPTDITALKSHLQVKRSQRDSEWLKTVTQQIDALQTRKHRDGKQGLIEINTPLLSKEKLTIDYLSLYNQLSSNGDAFLAEREALHIKLLPAFKKAVAARYNLPIADWSAERLSRHFALWVNHKNQDAHPLCQQYRVANALVTFLDVQKIEITKNLMPSDETDPSFLGHVNKGVDTLRAFFEDDQKAFEHRIKKIHGRYAKATEDLRKSRWVFIREAEHRSVFFQPNAPQLLKVVFKALHDLWMHHFYTSSVVTVSERLCDTLIEESKAVVAVRLSPHIVRQVEISQ